MKSNESQMLDQFDQFSLKLPSYKIKYNITDEQVTGNRSDYLWMRHAITCTSQFAQEYASRVAWKDKLKDGPASATAAQVPGLGSEFVAPNVPPVPDGVVGHWRDLVNHIKGHTAYDPADGLDLGIESVTTPAQQMTPTATFTTINGFTAKARVRKDGHEAVAVYSRRGNEPGFTKLGVYTRASITDARPPLTPGVPETREYQFQYVDGDQPVGEMSSIYSVVLSGAVAA